MIKKYFIIIFIYFIIIFYYYSMWQVESWIIFISYFSFLLSEQFLFHKT